MLKYFLNPKKGISYMLKFVLGILNFQTTLQNLKTFFYMLNNDLSHIQPFFVFLLQKDSQFDHDDADVFFLFLLQKYFYICLQLFFVF